MSTQRELIINTYSDRQTFYKDKIGISKYEARLVDYERERAIQVEDFKATLGPEEVETLEAVWNGAKQGDVVTLPDKLQDKGWFETLKVGELSHNLYERYYYLRQIPKKLHQYRPSQPRQFHIPTDYRDVSFNNFEFLCEGHKRAWLLLTHFGPTPPKGLYLWGNYGSGKTHLIAAFARGLQAEITAGTFGRIADFASGTIAEYEQAWAANMVPAQQAYDEVRDQWYKHHTAPHEAVVEKEKEIKAVQGDLEQIAVRHLRRAWLAYPYQPTDLAFATFDYLFERSQDEAFVKDFLGRKVVMIDDIHPKDDRARLDFIQRIVEQRYNESRTGATFITSNLPPDRVLTGPNYPKEIAERGHSRLREMCMPIEFDTGDYRIKKAASADEELLRLVEQLESDLPAS